MVAAVDDRFAHFLPSLKGGDVKVMDTSQGGHPSAAFVRAYRENPEYLSYLFLQDSLEATVDDCVQPFASRGSDVVAWGLFGLCFDGEHQERWVKAQYEGYPWPDFGIFGPIFYATRVAMNKVAKLDLFPLTPNGRIEAQGTERAWAFAFTAADVPVDSLGGWNNEEMSSGRYPVFRKTFAGRP